MWSTVNKLTICGQQECERRHRQGKTFRGSAVPWVATSGSMATPDAINPASIAPGPEARRDSTVIGKSLSKTVTDTITGPISELPGLTHFCLRPFNSLHTTRGSDGFARGLVEGLTGPPGAGEHEHTIVGYSLVKGIGDGEPIASERFSVGGHEWVRPTALYVPNTALKGQGSRQVKCAGSSQSIEDSQGQENGYQSSDCSGPAKQSQLVV